MPNMSDTSLYAKADDIDMKRKGAVIAGTIIAIVVVVILLIYFLFIPYYLEQSWGAEGELELTLTADSTTMDMDGTLNLSYTLRNVGDTDLRILHPSMSICFAPIGVYNSTGRSIEDVMCPDCMPPVMKDEDLHLLKAGEMVSFRYVISNGSFLLVRGETFHAHARYYEGHHERITLPYWKGELESENVYFTVED